MGTKVDHLGLFKSSFTYTQKTILDPSQITSANNPKQPIDLDHAFSVALSILHSPETLIRLNPLVTDFKKLSPDSVDESKFLPLEGEPIQSPHDPTEYFQVTDTTALPLGLSNFKTTYQVALTRLDNGCDTVVQATAGVRIDGTWRVLKGGDDAGTSENGNAGTELTLLENAKTTCPTIFVPFISSTMGSSHKELHQHFAEKWGGELSKAP